MSASRKVFDADLERYNRAFRRGGWVETGTDAHTGETFRYVSPDAPQALLRPYQMLLAFGYANGLL